MTVYGKRGSPETSRESSHELLKFVCVDHSEFVVPKKLVCQGSWQQTEYTIDIPGKIFEKILRSLAIDNTSATDSTKRQRTSVVLKPAYDNELEFKCEEDVAQIYSCALQFRLQSVIDKVHLWMKQRLASRNSSTRVPQCPIPKLIPNLREFHLLALLHACRNQIGTGSYPSLLSLLQELVKQNELTNILNRNLLTHREISYMGNTIASHPDHFTFR